MEGLGVGDSIWLCACPQGHTSPTFLSEEIAFERFLLLVCIRRTTRGQTLKTETTVLILGMFRTNIDHVIFLRHCLGKHD